ncbi:hypothetical protein ACFL5G_01185 [Candidatus Margulisiibacteriota bacterium]
MYKKIIAYKKLISETKLDQLLEHVVDNLDPEHISVIPEVYFSRRLKTIMPLISAEYREIINNSKDPMDYIDEEAPSGAYKSFYLAIMEGYWEYDKVYFSSPDKPKKEADGIIQSKAQVKAGIVKNIQASLRKIFSEKIVVGLQRDELNGLADRLKEFKIFKKYPKYAQYLHEILVEHILNKRLELEDPFTISMILHITHII